MTSKQTGKLGGLKRWQGVPAEKRRAAMGKILKIRWRKFRAAKRAEKAKISADETAPRP